MEQIPPCCRFRNWEESKGKTKQRTIPDNLKDYNTLNDVLNKSKWLEALEKKCFLTLKYRL